MQGYNNTEVDVGVGFGGTGGGGIADSCSNGATDCQYFNNIYYYAGSITDFNGIGVSGDYSRSKSSSGFLRNIMQRASQFYLRNGTWLGGCATCLLTESAVRWNILQ